jgi:hypothetical protein
VLVQFVTETNGDPLHDVIDKILLSVGEKPFYGVGKEENADPYIELMVIVKAYRPEGFLDDLEVEQLKSGRYQRAEKSQREVFPVGRKVAD